MPQPKLVMFMPSVKKQFGGGLSWVSSSNASLDPCNLTQRDTKSKWPPLPILTDSLTICSSAPWKA